MILEGKGTGWGGEGTGWGGVGLGGGTYCDQAISNCLKTCLAAAR